MKTHAPKTTSTALQPQKGNQPFFNKEGEGAFFSQDKVQLKAGNEHATASSFFGGQNSNSPFFTPSFIQAKLAIGQPGDKYEQEADAMADQVVSQISQNSDAPAENPVQTKVEPAGAIRRNLTASAPATTNHFQLFEKLEESQDTPEPETEIRRKPLFESAALPPEGNEEPPSENVLMAKSEGGEITGTSHLQSQLNATKGSGNPLPRKIQMEMESGFDADFSGVRIHTGNRASKMNQGLHARAFAHGNDIYFNQGNYSPNSLPGKKLLAHELAHVVQGHPGIRRNLEDYDIVPLGEFNNMWSVARFYGLNPAEIEKLNKKAYREEYGRDFRPRRLFPNSRIFLPKGTIPNHSNFEATEVELKKKTIKAQRVDDPLYPGTMQEYELRYYVTEYDDEDTEEISYDLVISQKIDILQDNGAQFTLKLWTSIDLDTFDVERQSMTWQQLNEIWKEASKEVGGVQISIQTQSGSEAPVPLQHVGITVTAYLPDSQGASPQEEFVGVGEAFGDLDSSIKDKYQAAIQVTREKIDKSSYSFIDYENRLDGEVYYTLREADAALIRMEQFPGDGVVTATRDGRYRAVPLTQGDMYFIADFLRNGNNPYVSTPRLWWVKENERIVHFMHDGFFESMPALLDNLFFPTFEEAKEHAEKSAPPDSVVFLEHTNEFYGWLLTPAQDLERILDQTVANLPPGATFEGFAKIALPTIKLSIPPIMPAKAFGLSSGEQFHLIDQAYFEGRDIWLVNETAFSADVEPNPIIDFINNNGDEGRKLYRYLQVEMDRKMVSGKNLAARIKGEGKEQLEENLQSLAVSQIWHWSKNKALEIVNTSVARLTTLKNERESLQAYLLSYLQLETNGQKTLFFDAMGLDDGQVSKAKAVFSNKKKFYSVLLGNTENGVSIEWFQEIIGETFKELETLKKDIESNETIPIEMKGGFGNAIREATYKHFGLDLKPSYYPHEKEAEYGTTVVYGGPVKQEKFRSIREEQWAKYTAQKAQEERRRDYLITGLKVVAAVGLIIISAGIGSGVAAAFFVEGSAAFIATEVFVGAVAYTILQEGFDQMTGGGQIDFDKDYIGLGDLGISFLQNLLFFGIFQGLGAALRSYGAIVRIAGTTSAFLAVEYISYIVTHDGELPKGHDLNLLLFRTFLTVALLEGGSILARPYTRAMIRAGKSARFNRFLDKVDVLHAETKVAQDQLAEVLAKPKRTSKEQFDLLDKQLNLLERRAEVLREIQADTEVSVEGRSDVDVAAEASKISDVIKVMREARFQAEVGMHQMELAGNTYSYRRGPSDITGKDAAKAFEDYYGQGNVTGPDPNGIITVKAGGSEMTFVPENIGFSGSAIGKELSSPKYAESVRGVEEGVVIFEPAQAKRFENLFKSKGGTWKEINPNTFIGELGGKSTVFLSEFSFNMAETALKAEATRPGAGMQVLKANLRSTKALKGLEAWEYYEMRGIRDVEKLQELKKLEDAGRTGRPKESLHRILEKKWEQFQLKEEAGALWKELSTGGFHRLPEVRKAMRMTKGQRADAEAIIQAEIVEFVAAQQVAVRGEKQFTSVEPARKVEGVNSIAEYRAKNTGPDAIKRQKLREFTDPVTGEVSVWESLGEVDILQTSPDNTPLRGYEVKSGERGSHSSAIDQLNEAFSALQQVHGDAAKGNTTFRVFERGAKATYEKDLTDILDLSTASSIEPKSAGLTSGFDITVKMTEEPVESSGFGKKNRGVLKEAAKRVFDNRTELLND